MASPEPPELGPGPRAGVWSRKQVDTAVEQFAADHSLPATREPHLKALALLWHDHLDEAHKIVQDGEDIDSAYLHAILHRREPDYSNAKYWFRRVKEHPCFAKLAAEIARLPVVGVTAGFVPQGRWDPFAFVDACQMAANKFGGDEQLRKVQEVEFELLAEYLGRPAQE